ncbi:MAG: signal peptide peptidase SppA [Bacteroidia bacterium]
MKQFFKFMFASMLGFFLCIFVVTIIFFIFIAALVASVDKKETTRISANTVLEIRLDQPVTQRTENNPLKSFDFGKMKSNFQPGLNDIVECIDKAADDKDIKGIYLNVENVSGGLATIEEIRNALLRFKKSNKFIISYGEFYSQNAYYLSSVADQIYLNPEGEIDLRGYAATLMFMKGALDKLEIEPEVIRHGKFKSAIEPFIADKMSDANREQVKRFVDDFWNHTKDGIATSRKKSSEEIENIADSMKVESAEDAVKYGLADKLMYEDELMDLLKTKSGTKDEKPKLVSLTKYNKTESKVGFEKDKIAVIYAVGEISSGKGDDESIGSETTVADIRKARLDKNVKAIVLRVNSPGGSALASDVIWREVVLAKKAKPVVVSMGDLAASGGYYISCAADKIVAQPNTITGSIGVFGLLFNMQKLFNNKLGLTFDTYKTGPYGDLGLPTRPLTESERMKMQNSVERVYDTFTKRVADGRHINQADVDSIGQGRVWSGNDALRIGLVDTLGNLGDAIKIAARLSKTDKYRIYELPEQKDTFQEIIKELNGDVQSSFIKNELGDNAKYYQSIKQLVTRQGIQMRMDFDVEVK